MIFYHNQNLLLQVSIERFQTYTSICVDYLRFLLVKVSLWTVQKPFNSVFSTTLPILPERVVELEDPRHWPRKRRDDLRNIYEWISERTYLFTCLRFCKGTDSSLKLGSVSEDSELKIQIVF